MFDFDVVKIAIAILTVRNPLLAAFSDIVRECRTMRVNSCIVARASGTNAFALDSPISGEVAITRPTFFSLSPFVLCVALRAEYRDDGLDRALPQLSARSLRRHLGSRDELCRDRAAFADGGGDGDDGINVVLDQARLIKLPDRVSTFVIGNPLIADASMQAGGLMVRDRQGLRRRPTSSRSTATARRCWKSRSSVKGPTPTRSWSIAGMRARNL